MIPPDFEIWEWSCTCKESGCFVPEGQHLCVGGVKFRETGYFPVYCPKCDCAYKVRYKEK